MSNYPVPYGWNLIPLGDIALIQTGLAKGPKDLEDPVELPYLRVANVQDGYLDLSEIKEITVERSQVQRYLLQVGDVLLTEGGDNDKLGRGAVWNGEIPVCLHQNHVFAVRPDASEIEPFYLSSLTSSSYGKLYFRKASKQSTNLASINSTQLKAFPVLLPPLPEQRAIAAILSTWDEAITLTEHLIAALRQRKQGLMQLLLTGAVRFLEFEDEEWNQHEFGDFAFRCTEQFNPNGEEEYPCVELEHISQESGQILGFVSTSQQKSLKIHFKAGQILFGKLRPYLKKYAQPDFDGVCSSEIWVLDANRAKCSNDYLFYIVQSEPFIEAASVTSGTKMPRADWNYISEVVFMLPSVSEQDKIVNVLKASDRKIRLMEAMSNSLYTEKKALMQQLLTGQIRVQVAE